MKKLVAFSIDEKVIQELNDYTMKLKFPPSRSAVVEYFIKEGLKREVKK
jgi:metal-responsive CopG/Arc/MetJ family transcriptional regulator